LNKLVKTRKQLLLPFVMIYMTVSGVWVLHQYGDWIYLLLALAAVTLFIYQYFEDLKQLQQEAGLNKEMERKRTEDRIRHMAYYDDLTGLPNRRSFREELTKALHLSKKNKQVAAVMFIDIDRFKLINDSLGHDYGDILLLQVAERLTRKVTDKDFIARMEGDEFALFFTELEKAEEAEEIAQAILKELDGTFFLQDYQLHITLSIGISFYLQEDETAEILMKYSNTALSRAKDQGRNNYQIYTHAMNIRSIERLTLENDLQRAIEQNEFILYYQPQINTSTGEIVGAEALIRWNHPIKGLVSPAKFIPLAEENGMIVPIGDWVMRTACKQNKAWQDAAIMHIPISVNLSTRQFLQQNLVGKVADILTETGLDPKYLELEITESMTMDVEHAIGYLQELKQLGIGISIDDFGTGYSSLSYLKKFPINKLKIDRSFVRDIMEDPNDAAIVSTIIAMAHGLDMSVIAEGVETREQLEYLSLKSCNEVQGFYFSPPVSAESFIEGFNRFQEVSAGKELNEDPTRTS
jgi:diguanylate cyclase (GGDEF)-like protein